MSRIFLLRHAQSEANAKGILAGRMENISLSKQGIKERDSLNLRLSGVKFDRVLSSPIQRCLETIQEFHSNPDIQDEFAEVDYGDWTGRKMSSLMRNKAWREIHKNPASVRFPNGETLPFVLDLQKHWQYLETSLVGIKPVRLHLLELSRYHRR